MSSRDTRKVESIHARLTVRMLRRGRWASLTVSRQLMQLRGVTDAQLAVLRSRAVTLLLHVATPAGAALADCAPKARQLLDWVLAEQRARQALAALPNPREAMELHRRSDAELLDEGKKALLRFEGAVGRHGELAYSARLEAARLIDCLKVEWAYRHAGADLLAVLKRGAPS